MPVWLFLINLYCPVTFLETALTTFALLTDRKVFFFPLHLSTKIKKLALTPFLKRLIDEVRCWINCFI